MKETLGSFLELNWVENISLEVLAVDNNSDDDTKDVVNEFIRQDSRIKYVFEDKSGLSYARNRGISEAKGKIIAFTDDDVIFDKDWGQNLINTFRDNPEVWSVGGKTIPVFPEGKPLWINEDILGMYGDIQMGDETKIMEFPYHPYGCNMAFRREIFNKVGMFNTELGRKKKNLLSNEEHDFFYRIAKDELKVVYSPHVIVKHKIPASRTQKKWILKRNYWQGISNIAFEQTVNPKPRKVLFVESLADLKTLIKKIMGTSNRSVRKIYWFIRGIKFESWVNYYYTLGEIRQKLFSALSVRN